MNPSPSLTNVREGDLLAGKYRIEKILGVGGMGVVVAAQHIHLDERVAIKFLLPEMVANGEAVARFAREARAAVKIKSEHVARVSDVGTLENGAPYMVMEYLEGGDLSEWIRQRGALSIEQATEFTLQACEAIAEAHALGIVHRDLKPSNLFVIRRAHGSLVVKVLDFGISKMRNVSSSVPDPSMTKTSAMMGSPLYMSPEQMQSAKDADARSDIWALGIILHELLTGESPFTADTIPELVAKILSVPPPPLRSRRPDAPVGLESAIQKCLEKDRNRRFESVAEFAAALAPFAPKRARVSLERISGVLRASGHVGAGTALPPSSDPTEREASAATQSAFGRTSAPHTKTALTAVLAMLVVLGLGAFFALRRPAEPVPAAPVATFAAPPAPSVSAEPPAPKLEPAPASIASAPSIAPVAASSAVAPTPSATPARTARARVQQKIAASPAATPPAAQPAPPPPPAPAQPKPTAAPKPKAGAFDDRR